jgi:mRNA interferase RelE/StbE
VTYTIQITSSAAKELRRLERQTQKKMISAIDGLKTDPRPEGVRKLVGAENLWRIRVGDYRIIYSIEDDVVLVTVIRVRHRREAY